jgi:ferrous iron transport protein A
MPDPVKKTFKSWAFELSFQLNMKVLTQAPHFETLIISNVIGEPGLTRRLREMGFHTGCEVRILGRAPFRGPFVIQLHDSVLALRRAEAECLLIK